MRTAEEREAATVWLAEQHRQFFVLEEILNVDFCYRCDRIVPEGSEHDAEKHGAIQ